MGCHPSTLNSDPSHRDDLQPQSHPHSGGNEVKREAVFSSFLSNRRISRADDHAHGGDGNAGHLGTGGTNVSNYQPNPTGNFSYGSVVGDSGAREPRKSAAKSHGKAREKVKASMHMSDGKMYSLTQGRIGDEVQMNGRGRKKSQPYDDGEGEDQDQDPDQHHGQNHKQYQHQHQHQHQTATWTNNLPSPNNEASGIGIGVGSGSGSSSKEITSRLPQAQPQAHTQPPKKSKQQLKAEARVRWSRTRDHSLQGAAFGFG